MPQDLAERVAPAEDEPQLPSLGVVGTLRWLWRRLTSMSTALVLLLMLAVGAVPGSAIPQRGVDATQVAQFRDENPDLSQWLDRFGMFDIYSSPWFSAVYLLLFISLVGCLLPRTLTHLKAIRAEPPRTPTRLARLPAYQRIEVQAQPDDVFQAARVALGRRYRVRTDTDAVRAETGHLRETGNLVFHLSLVGVLICVALGSLYGYRGQEVLTAGRGFANVLSEYDTFDPGTWVDEGDLTPFRFTFDDLESRFEIDAGGNQFAQPRDFTATVTVHDSPDAEPRQRTIKVNQPLEVGDTSVYLQGNGYAPVLTVRDADGRVVSSGPVRFLPQDATYTSTGVLKVADTSPQLGLQGIFVPTWRGMDPVRGAVSAFPALGDPRLVFTAWRGDLGIDDGVPQSVYTLDTSAMEQLTAPDGDVFSGVLRPGETIELPDGAGTVTFERVVRFAAFGVRHDPAKAWALGFSVLAMAGLVVSLFVPRRRVWVRAAALPDGGAGTVVEVAGLARGQDSGLDKEIARVAELIAASHAEVSRHEARPDDSDSQDSTERDA